ncbi:diguanylate cyclase domain-containing protein [Sulfurimonas sp.]
MLIEVSLQKDLSKKQFLKNEKIQIFLRIGLVSTFLSNLIYIFIMGESDSAYPFIYLAALPTTVIFLNIFYFFLLKKYPYLYQQQRITLIMILDIIATVCAFYYVGSMAIYYPGVMLWFIVGYGSRYGIKIGYIAYVVVLITWFFLLMYSTFWQENLDAGIGWLVTYAILPLYYFKLIEELQNRIQVLHKDVDESSYRAGHDILTGLPNRSVFEEELAVHIKNFEQNQQKFALFFIDLDDFKQVNDTYGHETGDKILIEASKRIVHVNSFTSRLGGDEFVSIVEYSSQKELHERAKKLIENLSKKCNIPEIILAASVGIATYPDDALSPYELKKHSDKAMYQAKNLGKNKYCFYSEL